MYRVHANPITDITLFWLIYLIIHVICQIKYGILLKHNKHMSLATLLPLAKQNPPLELAFNQALHN